MSNVLQFPIHREVDVDIKEVVGIVWPENKLQAAKRSIEELVMSIKQ